MNNSRDIKYERQKKHVVTETATERENLGIVAMS